MEASLRALVARKGNLAVALCVRRGMSRAVAAVFAVALALVSLNACGSTRQPGRAVPTPSTTSTTFTDQTAPPTKTPPKTTPTTKGTNPMPTRPTGPTEDRPVPPTKAGKHSTVRMRGTVSDGVESGCTLLTSNGVVYQLFWREGTPFTGTEIEVEGTLRPDLMTTCQQGTPLVVERILSP